MRALTLLVVLGTAWAQAPTPPDLSKPTLNRAPPPLFEAVVGIILEKNMKVPTVTPRLTTKLRITINDTGAIVKHAVEQSSGSPGFDAQVIAATKTYAVGGRDLLPVPKDPKLRKQALGDGILVPVHSPKPKKQPHGKKTAPFIPVPDAIANPPAPTAAPKPALKPAPKPAPKETK